MTGTVGGTVHTTRTAHTADLTAPELAAVRELLTHAFDGEHGAHSEHGAYSAYSDEDWDHTLGGVHVLLWEPGPGGEAALIAHAAVVQRRFLHRGRALRTGYVEGVAVRPDRQRRGYGGRVMAEAERYVRGGYDLGALSAADGAARLYAARGWQPWRGRTYVLAPDGLRRTAEEDDGVYVLPVPAPVPDAPPLDLDGDLVCDWRDGDVW
ncbi:GNAT family N-acetyltransferase [Streptomyces armeniacus]|uniref:GNAT family N-acetyltransferase n=1 Tax=Streptomyces armeniacus TaxID=83291 RepID=A0A345XI03_9ACTN|nr:GNAT family N-acetyltransferase [Streptomyces armeniacus]AXK31269.1 GNAT family N-acetyltransferase [Streptomyces armeniacus]